MNDSDDILINEISVPRTKLRDLIRAVWGHRKKNDLNVLKAKQLNLPIPEPLQLSKRPVWTPKKERNKKETPKQLDLPFPRKRKGYSIPKPPELEKPKVIKTLFSKKLDTTKPPFYQDADKWLKDNFVKGKDGISNSEGYTYIGPDLSKGFEYGRSVHLSNYDEKHAREFFSKREEYMDLWNMEVREKIMNKWPDEFAGMNEQFKLQK